MRGLWRSPRSPEASGPKHRLLRGSEGTDDVFWLAISDIAIPGITPPPRQKTSIQARGPFALGAIAMDSMSLLLFLLAAFLGGLTSGLSGFAMGLVVSGVWLHIIAPDQNALLIALCGLVTQGSGIWRVRKSIKWKNVLPF